VGSHDGERPLLSFLSGCKSWSLPMMCVPSAIYDWACGVCTSSHHKRGSWEGVSAHRCFGATLHTGRHGSEAGTFLHACSWAFFGSLCVLGLMVASQVSRRVGGPHWARLSWHDRHCRFGDACVVSHVYCMDGWCHCRARTAQHAGSSSKGAAGFDVGRQCSPVGRHVRAARHENHFALRMCLCD
jgi:hypothetical protein